MRDADPEMSDLQKALFGYEVSSLESALVKWTRDNWPMAARGMVYARKEADDTVSGVAGLRDEQAKMALAIAARVSISERELMCRAIAAVLPAWLEETYGLVPKGAEPAA